MIWVLFLRLFWILGKTLKTSYMRKREISWLVNKLVKATIRKPDHHILNFALTALQVSISSFFDWHHFIHAGCLSLPKCLVLGAGPCGLRTAIELSLLGAQVVVLEKRESFSRNNVLHLWPFTICDLCGLGAKKFYGRFCTGSLDHICEWLMTEWTVLYCGPGLVVFCNAPISAEMINLWKGTLGMIYVQKHK